MSRSFSLRPRSLEATWCVWGRGRRGRSEGGRHDVYLTVNTREWRGEGEEEGRNDIERGEEGEMEEGRGGRWEGEEDRGERRKRETDRGKE